MLGKILTFAPLLLVGCSGNAASDRAPQPTGEPAPTDPQTASAAGSGDPAHAEPTDDRPGRAEDQATLVVGRGFSCALHGGELYCWGDNRRGQLGIGGRDERRGPGRLRGLEGVRWLAAGDAHACATTRSGGVSCWGEAGPVGEQQGRGSARPTSIAGLAQVVGLAAGSETTCARLRAGQVHCFGPDRVPERIALPAAARAVRVGTSHACARLEGGAMRCWGMNFFGQLGVTEPDPGDGPHEPVGVSGVTRIALGSGHSCALREGGEVWCWGDHRPDRRYDQTIALPQRRAQGIERIIAGGLHTCLLSTDGSRRCSEVFQERVWPSGARGRAHHPAVTLPEGTVEAAIGEGHRCVRLESAAIHCWGNNPHGESAPNRGDPYLSQRVEITFPP